MESSDTITKCIQTLTKHIDILQASGDDAQGLLRPNEEEVEDRHRSDDDATLKRKLTEIFENPIPNDWAGYRAVPPLSREENHVFQFFLDGSVHARALGTALEGNRAFPLGLYQIGAAVARRDTTGRLSPHAVTHKILITIPGGSNGVSDTAWSRILSDMPGNAFCYVVQIDTKGDTTGRRAASDDIRLNSSAVAYGHMHNLEIALVDKIQETPDDSIWTIIDGSVQFGMRRKMRILGVSKQFWIIPDLQVLLSSSRRVRMNLHRLLAGLPPGHRTAIFEALEGDVGFWYVRLRSTPHNPIGGIVRVELPRVKRGEPVDADEADFISRALVAERTPSTYGIDRRWPSLLYPIHYTEKIIKNGFISEQVLDRIIRASLFNFQS
jgi:hypothetical protein